ncbi:hypothetical protein BDV36DRAFT_295050 [Aspergillus pseudocaelatus]|uniref:Uncharacterized protein n=1 Tax=Aspergillus pseudocaelatus TaxID=1825620 RepID=A0ABQ6WND8_9EURO|nr:hypothetical protein BDV36DRAFT_295050 [Aspergillus pseudocaelatus]
MVLIVSIKSLRGIATQFHAQDHLQRNAEPFDRPRDTPTEILDRLSQLETLLGQQKDTITELSARIAPIYTQTGYSTNCCVASSLPLHAPHSFNPSDHARVHTASTSSTPRRVSYNDEEPLIIPLGQNTPTTSLFGLSRVKSLIGEYQQDLFMQL